MFSQKLSILVALIIPMNQFCFQDADELPLHFLLVFLVVFFVLHSSNLQGILDSRLQS